MRDRALLRDYSLEPELAHAREERLSVLERLRRRPAGSVVASAVGEGDPRIVKWLEEVFAAGTSVPLAPAGVGSGYRKAKRAREKS